MIRIDGLAKRFRHPSEPPMTLKALLLGQRGRRYRPWVLEDIDLTIAAGESLSIVGRNGCGKTTLLRLIAGILRPERGSVRVDGRIAALLALGAGFHPDLTGEENIRLNAAILGLDRRAIRARLADIVEFSGLGDELAAPLRFYSSGMVVRLGFAVAAHVEPDVLLIDEVLAVGDAQFRERCHDLIARLQREGRTLILVSHDMAEVRRFAPRTLWLDAGRIAADGTPDDVVPPYLASYS